MEAAVKFQQMAKFDWWFLESATGLAAAKGAPTTS
jgi:hypothetical protein